MLASVPVPCRIQFIELSAAVKPLSLEGTPYRAIGLYFLLHGVPLGQRYLDAGELPLSAEQVWNVAVEAVLPVLTQYVLPELERENEDDRTRTHRLAALEPLEVFERIWKRRARPEVSGGRVSIVVCTRERPESLERCLSALQRLPDDSVEYIVVDNAPRTDATRRVVARYSKVRYCVEPRPGLSYARNTGTRQSHGEILAFTDDDVIVTADWLRELIRPFADSKVAFTTGLIVPAEMESPEQSWFEHWLSFSRGYLPLRFGKQWFERSRTVAPVWRIGAGANMAIRRSAFEQVGYFDTRLGAGASGCSEDSEFWYRLLSAGYDGEYVPAAYVLHHHRVDKAGLVNQMRMYARGHATALMAQFIRHGDAGNLIRLGVTLPILYLRKLASTVIFPEWRPFWTATLDGHFSGLFYLLGCGRDRSGEVFNDQVASTNREGDSVAVFCGPGSHAQD